MRSSSLVTPLLCAVVLACGDSVAPTATDVVGNYSATTFTTRDSSGTVNWLTQGALLNVVLAANDSTAGRLFVPGGADSGGDLDADLAGTWVLHGDTVEFDHAADTFVRDMPFVFKDNTLSGEATFSGATVRVVMVKQ